MPHTSELMCGAVPDDCSGDLDAGESASESSECECFSAGCRFVDGCRLWREGDLAEEAVRLIVDASREVDRVGVERSAGSTGFKCPEGAVDERHAIVTVEGAEEGIGCWIIDVDFAVAEVADEEIVAKGTEVGWSEGDSPWGEEGSAGSIRCDCLNEDAVGVKLIDLAAGHQATLGVDQLVGHVEIATDVLDVERDKSGGQVGVSEVAGQVGGCPGGVEDVDSGSRAGGGGVEESTCGVGALGASGVDGSGRGGHLDCGGPCSGVPGGDGAVKSIEDEAGLGGADREA